MPRRIRQIAEVVLALMVLAAAGSVFFNAKAKIDSDEAEWIGTTRYFQLYFVEHDVSAQSWPDEYWTRTQPMVVRYAIGGWLWLRGYDLKALDPTYDYTRNANINRRAGLGPSDELLAEARVPMRALAALSVLMLYLVVRVLAGPIGGLAAAGLAAGSPYLQEHLVRAKAESTLMFLLLATLLVAVVGIRRGGNRWPGLGWGIVTGILLGLAFGAKLTSILAIVSVAAWGGWACLSAWVSQAGPHPPGPSLPPWGGGEAEDVGAADVRAAQRPHGREEAGEGGASLLRARPWVWPVAALVTAGLVFLASNPFLWPDPVGRTWLLFDNRREEMARQQVNLPSRAIYELDRRAEIVWDRSVSNDAWGPSRLNEPVEAVLTAIGAGWLAFRAASRRPTALTLVFLWSASIWIGVTVGLGFLLQHYFVPTAMTADLLGGLAVGWAAQAVWWLSQRYLPWQRLPWCRGVPSRAALTSSPQASSGSAGAPGTVAESH